MDGFEPGKVPEVRQHDATEERVELGTDRAESEHAQDMSLGWHRRPSEPFVDADRLPDTPSVCSSPPERTRTRRPVQGIAFDCCEDPEDQLGLALAPVSRLGAASLGAAPLDSVVGTGAIEGPVLDDDELQAPTKRAAPRMRIATRDFNGHVLLGELGAWTTLRTGPARAGYGV